MCGHGTIGLIVTLAHMGRIKPGDHRIETTVGTVTATLHPDGTRFRQQRAELPQGQGGDGGGAGHRPGRRRRGVERQLVLPGGKARPGTGAVQRGQAHRLRLARPAGGERRAVSRRWTTSNCSARAKSPGGNSRNFVLCPGKAYDRSPCGTGTSAKAGLPGRGRQTGRGRHRGCRKASSAAVSPAVIKGAMATKSSRPSPARPTSTRRRRCCWMTRIRSAGASAEAMIWQPNVDSWRKKFWSSAAA